jgi:predicted MPP superfamily phosphohydrolase
MFLVYFLGNLYIYKRSVQALSLSGIYLNYYRVLFLVIVFCYPIARVGTSFYGKFFLSSQLNVIGSIFMGVMLYTLLIIIFVDILRLVNYFVHFFPTIVTKDKVLAGRVTFVFLFFIIFCITAYGVYNAKHLRVIEQEILLDKLKPEHNGFTIVQISDLHLGDILNINFLNSVVDKVNSLDPDIVVITGDLIDDGSTDLQILVPLINMKSKFGKYFISGNHDNFYRIRSSDTSNRQTINAADDKSTKPDSTTDNGSTFMWQSNFSRLPLAVKLKELEIKILHSKYVEIDSAFTLFGVEYRFGRGTNSDSMSITKLLEGYNKELPLIMLKHVPNDLDNIADAGVDLLLSGHTHHGQMIPLTFITDKVYEISNGYGRYKNLHVYVNCGTGFWGPPVKVGVPAEITKIILKSK